LCIGKEDSPSASAVDDSEGRLVDGGLELFMSSNRNAANGFDLYVAQRASLADAFSTPQPIAELDTPANEADPWLSEDGHYLVYSSDQSGSTEVYEAWR